MKKFLILFFSFLLLTSLLTTKASAAVDTLYVTCPGCSIDALSTNPLFSQPRDGVWYPGRSVTKVISMTNSDSKTRTMAIMATRTSNPSLLDDVMTIQIINNKTATLIYTGLLSNFYSQPQIELGDISAGETITFNMTATMDPNANDDYQGLESVFNLTLGFKSLPAALGGGLGLPGDGRSDGRSDGLSDGRSSGGGIGGLQGVLGAAVSGFTENVLGVEEEITPTITQPVETEEVKKETLGEICNQCNWWQILLGELAAMLVFYYLVLKQTDSRRQYLVLFLIPIIAFIVFVLTNCYGFLGWRAAPSIFCRFFWLLDLIVYLFFIVLKERQLRK